MKAQPEITSNTTVFTDKSINFLLELLRILVGNGKPGEICDNVDWREVYEISQRMQLASVVFGGLHTIYDTEKNLRLGFSDPGFVDVRVQWMCSLQNGNAIYNKHKKVIQELGDFFSSYGLGMMLLKGYGLSLHYPIPEYRVSGDIDCFLFYLNNPDSEHQKIPAWKFGDMLIRSQKGIKIDNSVHHHSVFKYNGVYIENHFDFINVPSHRFNKEIESRFKELSRRHGQEILPNVFLPSPDLNALFVLRHAAVHFAASELTFRQILDFVLLIRDTQSEIDWNSFWEYVDFMGMKEFAKAMINISVKELGFDIKIFNMPLSSGWDIDDDCDKTTKMVLTDIFSNHYQVSYPNPVKSLFWKFKRWWANRWKHKIVYKDSLLSTFIYQVFAHAIKPNSFL